MASRATIVAPPSPVLARFSPVLEDDMGRRRLQQKGDLYNQGGWWKLRWREDQVDVTGKTKYGWSKPVWIGPSKGQGKFTEKQAQRVAWDNFLSRLDQNMRTPQSVMTVREFVERKFIPEHVAIVCKPGGRVHYSTHIPIVLDGIPETKTQSRKKGTPEPKRIAGIGKMRLRDVTTEDCQRLTSEAISRGYSVQVATHIKNCISAIFTHAESKDWFSGSNPAKRVKLPEMTRKPTHALTFNQVRQLAAAVDPLSRAMVLCAVLTSMNVAEMLGLRWKHVNLTDDWATVDGESLRPWQIAIRGQWTLRQYGSVKAKGRRRDVIIPTLLAEALKELRRRDKFIGQEDAVFVSRSGTPVDEKNIMRRRLRPTAIALGMPWLGWHDLRRSFATLADQVGMTAGERQALMGHADARMTARYTKTPTENARHGVEEMGELLRGPKGPVQ
jgi:integrase